MGEHHRVHTVGDGVAERCDATGKVCFRSKDAARHKLRKLSARLRVYFCDHCRSWHLTSGV